MEGTRASYTRPFMAIPGETTMEQALKYAGAASSDGISRGTDGAILNKGAKEMAEAKDDAKAKDAADAKDSADEDEAEDAKTRTRSRAKAKAASKAAKEDAKEDAKDEEDEDEDEAEDAKSHAKAKAKGVKADVKKGDVHIHLPGEDDSDDNGDDSDDDSSDDSDDDSKNGDDKDDSKDDSKDDAKDESDEDEDEDSDEYARNYARAYASAMAEAKSSAKAAKANLKKGMLARAKDEEDEDEDEEARAKSKAKAKATSKGAFPGAAKPFGKDAAKEDAKDDEDEDEDAKAKARVRAKAKAAAADAVKGALTVEQVLNWTASLQELKDKLRSATGSDITGPAFDQGGGDGNTDVTMQTIDLGAGIGAKVPSVGRVELMGDRGPGAAGITGDGAPGFKSAVLDIVKSFVTSDEFIGALAMGREAKAAVEDAQNSIETKAAELDTKSGEMMKAVRAEMTKAIDELKGEQEKIKRMTQPSKSAQGEGLTAVDKAPANKQAGANSDFVALITKAASSDPGIAQAAQEQLREIVQGGELDTAKGLYRASFLQQ